MATPEQLLTWQLESIGRQSQEVVHEACMKFSARYRRDLANALPIAPRLDLARHAFLEGKRGDLRAIDAKKFRSRYPNRRDYQAAHQDYLQSIINK